MKKYKNKPLTLTRAIAIAAKTLKTDFCSIEVRITRQADGTTGTPRWQIYDGDLVDCREGFSFEEALQALLDVKEMGKNKNVDVIPE